MPRARTGSVEPFRDASGKVYLKARIRLSDGSRTRVDIPEKHWRQEGRAAEYAAFRQEKEDADGELLAAKLAKKTSPTGPEVDPAAETATAWYGRYNEYRTKQLGHTSAREDFYRWKKWIDPRIGAKPLASVTRAEVEDLRDALDVEIRTFTKTDGKEGLAPGSAAHIWGVLASSFRVAASCKRRDLRVLPDEHVSPCSRVQSPERGDARRKPFIWPSEFLSLASCERVPHEWREVHAIACYLYLRPGELRVLRWSDIDGEHGICSVTKAFDYSTGLEKPPKTNEGIRDVPIPPALLPLLERMRAGKDEDALVVPVLAAYDEDHLAKLTRAHLEMAGVKRTQLFASSASTMPVGFRSWRDTGITWLAIEGVDLAKIQKRAGHRDVATTVRYVKMADALRDGSGTPFPVLPESLVDLEHKVEWAKVQANFPTIEAFMLRSACGGWLSDPPCVCLPATTW